MHRRRTGRIVALLALVWALVVGNAGVAATPPAATEGGPAAAPAQPVRSQRVTLLTGDVVTVRALASGQRAYTVDAAPRQAGTRAHFVSFDDGQGSYYVFPSDTLPYVTADRVDRELFNVTALVEAGYAERDTLPLIVTYEGDPAARTLASRASALPASDRTLTLESIGGAALSVDRDRATAFWRALASPAAATASARAAMPAADLGGGIDKIWLDGRVEATLDESVPQVGAPAVWEAGFDGTGATIAVLDTGVDASHPDLAGRVVEQRNFTPAPDGDGNGHGTHVASIAAGTGAASEGQFRGVAPGASIVAGKVLDNGGFGQASWVIEGMEWAATTDADVINMSLGGSPSDGTDPLSEAVDRLTEETGKLFAIAAGNFGATATVGAPGSADLALTVGNVDKQDALAKRSSRGPRLGDGGVKPNLVAPGVEITAARAAGTGLGQPVGEHYTILSGTSMATPHVAGAAALLASAHPDWTGEQIRRALVGSAVDVGRTPFEQGSGRLDVAAAFRQEVMAGPAALDFGNLDEAGGQVTRTVEYANHGAGDVTLSLAIGATTWDGRTPVPDGALRLGASSVTVPAGGTATVDVLVDPAVTGKGVFGGTVTATAGGLDLRTPLSWRVAPPSHTVTVRAETSDGSPTPRGKFLFVWASRSDRNPVTPTDPFGQPFHVIPAFEGVGSTDLPEGAYDFQVQVNQELHPDGARATHTFVPDVAVDRDVTVTLSARGGQPLKPRTRERTDQMGIDFGYHRERPDGSRYGLQHVYARGNEPLYVAPAPEARGGTLELMEHYNLQLAPSIEVVRGARFRLEAQYDPWSDAPELAGDRTLPVAWVGQGRPEDFEGVDVTGKLALIGSPLGEGVPPGFELQEWAKRTSGAVVEAEKHGAYGVLVYIDHPFGLAVRGMSTDTMAALGITFEQGDRLRDLLEDGREVAVRIRGEEASPFAYHLRYRHVGSFGDDHRHVVRKHELTRIRATYRAERKVTRAEEAWLATTPLAPGGITANEPFPLPTTRTEYVGTVDPRFDWLHLVTTRLLPPDGAADQTLESWRKFSRRQRLSEDWFTAPQRMGAFERNPDMNPRVLTWCSLCQDGNVFVPPLERMDNHPLHFRNFRSELRNSSMRMFRNGQPVPSEQARFLTVFPMGGEPADFRFELDYVDPEEGTLRDFATRTHTTWEWRSRPPGLGDSLPEGYTCGLGGPCAYQPLIQPTYEVAGLDGFNRARAGRVGFVWLTARSHELAGAPPTTGAKLWYSTDAGKSWRRAPVLPFGHGRFLALVWHPDLERTDGTVWLKVQARDAAGNQVTQVVERAYGLR